MEEQKDTKKIVSTKNQFSKHRASIEEKITGKHLNHAVSMIYQTQYISKQSLVQPYRRNKSQKFTRFQNINKEDIFYIVYQFVGKLITSSDYIWQLMDKLKFKNQEFQVSVNKLSRVWNNSSESIENDKRSLDGKASKDSSLNSLENEAQENEIKISIKQVPPSTVKFQSDEIVQSLKDIPRQISVIKKQDKNLQKYKVSIMVDSLGITGSINQLGSACSSWFSMETSIHLQDLKVPQIILSNQLIKRIYEEPQPFLINLSLCLMLKFLFYSKMSLDCENSCWILSISTIVAYKIYYDQPVENLFESFSLILQISEQDIRELERYFLQTIQFKAMITNEQYQQMLTNIIGS